MNLKQMDYFVRVVEAGSISRAAELANVAQPALSRHIRLMEEELGVQLLRRNGRGIAVTEQGDRLLTECRGILRQVERVQDVVSGTGQAGLSRFTLGMPSSVCTYLGAPLVRRLRSAYPGLKLQLVQGRSNALKDSLVSGRLDMAVLYGVSALTSVEKLSLCDDELVLVSAAGAPGGPVDAAELGRLPLIMRLHPNLVRGAVETFLARHGVQLEVEIEIDTISTIVDLVADGLGHTVLSRRLVNSLGQRNAVQMRQIVADDGGLSVTLHAVTPARPATEHSELLPALLAEIRAALADSDGAAL